MMTDREKVIAQLTADMDIAKLTGESLVHIMRETVEDALALLKEQEPVKPIKTLDGNGNLWRDCGKCGGVLPKDAQYCPMCGKKVKRDA